MQEARAREETARTQAEQREAALRAELAEARASAAEAASARDAASAEARAEGAQQQSAARAAEVAAARAAEVAAARAGALEAEVTALIEREALLRGELAAARDAHAASEVRTGALPALEARVAELQEDLYSSKRHALAQALSSAPPRTNRTRLVPPPVLTGHASSLRPY